MFIPTIIEFLLDGLKIISSIVKCDYNNSHYGIRILKLFYQNNLLLYTINFP